jgi:hypothetical protein
VNPPAVPPRGYLSPRLAAALAVAITLAAMAVILWAGRHRNFFSDEWGLLLYRRSGGFDAFFAPHNGHLQAALVASYRFLFESVGIDSYTPYRVAALVPQIAVAATVFLYARRRLQPELAALVLVPLVFMAHASGAVLWPYIAGFVAPIACFVGCLLLLDGEWRWRGPAIAALLLVALLSSSLGGLVLIGVAVELALRREWRLAIESLGLPAILYAAWFLLYRPGAETPASLREIPGAWPRGDLGSSGFSLSNLGAAPEFALDMARTGANGLIGLGPLRGGVVPLLVIVVGLAIVAVRRGRLSPRLAAIVAVLALFWVTTALSRADLGGATSSRYTYVSAALLLLIAIEVAAGLRLRTWALAAVVAVTGAILVADLRQFRVVSDRDQREFAALEATLIRLERDGAGASREEQRELGAFLGLNGGTYFPLIEELGSPVPERSPASVGDR